MKNLISKLVVASILPILVGIPFTCLYIVFHSKLVWLVGWILGFILLFWVLITGFNRFVQRLQARPADPLGPLGRSLTRIRAMVPEGKEKIQFWVIPSPEIAVHHWAKSRNAMTILLTQGVLNTATEAELKDIYKNGLEILRKPALRNAALLKQEQWCLEQFFNSLKGKAHTFRYWFVSFWLLPFEKTLNFTMH